MEALATAAAAPSSSGAATAAAIGAGEPTLVAELLVLGVCQGLQHTRVTSGRVDLRMSGWVNALLAGEWGRPIDGIQ